MRMPLARYVHIQVLVPGAVGEQVNISKEPLVSSHISLQKLTEAAIEATCASSRPS